MKDGFWDESKVAGEQASTRIIKRTHVANVRRDINWNEVDWSRPVSDISKELGVNKRTIYTMRQQYSPITSHRMPGSRQSKTYLDGVDWSRSDKDIAEECGVDRSTITKWRNLK